MKKKIITLAISTIMAFSSISVLAAEDNNYEYKAEANFNDVSKDYWAYDAIAKCQDLGIICGYGDGNFGPDDPVKMDQAVLMVLNCAGLYDTGNKEQYTLVDPWHGGYEKALENAWDFKIIPYDIKREDYKYLTDEQFKATYVDRFWLGGRFDTYKDCDTPAYREEAFSCFYRTYDNFKFNDGIEKLRAKRNETFTINDNPNIPDYGDITELYKSDIMEAYKLGIAKGYNDAGEFKPKNEITRAEFCQIIENANVTDMLHFKLNGSL